MKRVSYLVKPASSQCNMRCAYCFYADVAGRRDKASYGVMTRDTARRLMEAALEEAGPGGGVTFAFQGGEPTLAGLDFYRWFFSEARALAGSVPVDFSVQTNGLLLDGDWCALFREHGVLTGLSIDGVPQLHNALRRDAGGRGTYDRARRAMDLLRRHGVPFNVLAVLTAQSARRPEALWNWLQREGVGYVQFIPCLAPPDAPAPWALTPRGFSGFYQRLFPLWRRDLEAGRFVSVKLFDDLINQFLLGRATACGITGRCAVQNVVEADGSLFPCDFYALDSYRMGSVWEEARPSAAQSFLTEGREYAQAEPCRSCRYLSRCGGGCKRMKDSVCFENGVCRYAELLDRLLPPLLALAANWVRTPGG